MFMKYRQITTEERYTISELRKQGATNSQIARYLGRAPSTISREIARNLDAGSYRANRADQKARERRRASRRKWQFSDIQLQIVTSLIKLDWSPEQIANWLANHRLFSISHETIYRYIWYNKYFGGTLFKHLRQAGKVRRKRYGAYDSRGILATKRHISERPISAENKSRIGHWEIDTVQGARDKHCIVTLVDRKTKYTLIGKLRCQSTEELNKVVIKMILNSPLPFKTITADNGTEFHGYKGIEEKTGVTFYFATPHHSWERGLNENTNGLIRQYLPKRQSMLDVCQMACDKIANKLNQRPRKTLAYATPLQACANYI